MDVAVRAAPGVSQGRGELRLAYGLVVASELPLPELDASPPAWPRPDVDVRCGAVPEALDGATWSGPFLQVRGRAALLTVPEVARFLVEDGRRITVDAPDPASPSTRLFLLGSAMGALLHQRGLFVLHASTVEADGRGVAFVGKSGAGKSTLAHAFQQAGYRVVSDDVTAVTLLDGQPVAVPGFPRIKLWRDALRHLGTDPEGHERIRPTLEKYNIPLGDAYLGAPVPLHRVYVLAPHNRDTTEVVPLHGAASFHALRRNTYRPRFVEALGNREVHFAACARLAATVPVRVVRRPSDGFRMHELMAAVRGDLRA